MAKDAVFVLGGADTQIALLQTGIRPGGIAVVSGTTSPVVAELEQLFYDPAQRVWTDAGLGAESYQVEMNPGVTGLNYQRVKDRLCADIPYERLEEIYREKTSFACTASFSSLLFYQRRSLRRGGFFMRAPLDAEADRTDLAWAVLADIACSTHEQLQHLVELTGNEGGPILGCGGGFQSEALCQMLSDLSGRELRLRAGFRQATVQGLVTLCNDYLGEVPAKRDSALKTYHPRTGQLIHQYAPAWREARDREEFAMLMQEERELVVEYGKKMSAARLSTGTSGNISIYNAEKGLVALSPSGMDYFSTTPEDVVILDLDAKVVDGKRKPSSEWALHTTFYKHKPHARAVVHTHSVYCTTLAVLGEPIRAVHYVIGDAGAAEVPCAPYQLFGTEALAEAAMKVCGKSDGVLLGNHGLVCCGKDIKSAYGLACNLEFIAELQCRAMSIGKPNVLTEEQMAEVMVKFQSYGQPGEKKTGY